MKKNILFTALVSLAALVACEAEYVYEPGKPTVDNDYVYFSTSNAPSVVMASDETEIKVLVSRRDSTDALTVPVKAWASVPEAFNFPASVEFAAGKPTAEYVITTSASMEMFKDYSLQLSVPEEYTHAYDTLSLSPNYNLKLIKEDYVPYANGYYWSGFFEYAAGWEAWEQVLEYSAILDQYRFSALWSAKSTMTFKWDGDQKFEFEKSYSTGLNAGYGVINALPKDASYDAATKTMTINVEMFDSSTWGEFPEMYMITEIL